jgi:hypothetical protein
MLQGATDAVMEASLVVEKQLGFGLAGLGSENCARYFRHYDAF